MADQIVSLPNETGTRRAHEHIPDRGDDWKLSGCNFVADFTTSTLKVTRGELLIAHSGTLYWVKLGTTTGLSFGSGTSSVYYVVDTSDLTGSVQVGGSPSQPYLELGTVDASAETTDTTTNEDPTFSVTKTERLSTVTAFAGEHEGADVGAQVQAAMDAAETEATIHLGLYPDRNNEEGIVSSTLQPKARQSILGQGIVQSVLKSDGFAGHLLEYTDESEASNFTVERLRLDADKANRSDTNPTLYLKTNSDEHLEHLWIQSSPGYGIHKVNGWGTHWERVWVENGDDWGAYIEYPGGAGFDAAPTELYIEDCTFDTNDGGIFVGSGAGRGTVSDSEITTASSSTRNGLTLNAGQWKVTACDIQTFNSGVGVDIVQARCAVTGTHIFTAGGAGVDIAGSYCSVSGGQVRGGDPGVIVDVGRANKVSTTVFGGGIGVQDQGTATSVAGCTLENLSNIGLYADGSAGSVMVGNTLYNTAESSLQPIRVRAATRPIIAHNHVLQDSGARTITAAIVLTGTTTDAYIIGNQIHGADINNAISIESNCSDTRLWGDFPDGIIDNGTRTRHNGVIGGGPLGGTDIGSLTGASEGDIARSDGTNASATADELFILKASGDWQSIADPTTTITPA